MRKLLSILAIALAFASCTKTQELEKQTNPLGFRGLFSDSNLSWIAGNTIYITNGSASGTYSAMAAGKSADFKKASGDSLTKGPFTAYFPVEAKDGIKVDSIQNGKGVETGCYSATSSNTILLFKPMAGNLALNIDCQGTEIAGISIISDSFRHEIVPAEDATLPYLLTLLPGKYDDISFIIRTTGARIYTVKVPSEVTIEAGEKCVLNLALSNCREMDAVLAEGPAVNAAISKVAPDMQELVIAAGSEMTSTIEIQSSISRTPIYFSYDDATKKGTISTLAPVIRTGTDLSRLFAGLDKLRTIEGLTSITMERVEKYSGMFKGCAALEEIDLSGFNTAKAQALDSLFFGCSSLKALDCSTFNVRKATSLRAMFAYCSAIDTLNINNLETYSMTDGSYMFYNCTSLRKLYAAGLYSLNLSQDCSGMFFGDVNLGMIYFGANFYGATFDESCNLACDTDTPFSQRLASAAGKLDIYCARSVATALAKTSLRWINSGFEGAKAIPVTFFQDRFGLEGPSYDTLKRITWAADIPDAYLPDGKNLNLATKTFVNGSTVSATTTNAAAVKSIEFKTNVDMSTITGGADVSLYGDGMIIATFKDGALTYNTACDKYIATSSLDYMFDSYKNVKKIKGFDKINIEKVTSASYMFNECANLDSLDLSTFAFSEPTSLKYMFNNCSSLKYLDISKLTRVKATGIQHLFYGTVSLKTLKMNVFNNAWSYASYNDGFQGDSATTLLGANATAENPCEVWTTLYQHIVLMLSQNYSETFIHSSLMRKHFVEGKIRFRYPGKNNPWTVNCTLDSLKATPTKPTL